MVQTHVLRRGPQGQPSPARSEADRLFQPRPQAPTPRTLAAAAAGLRSEPRTEDIAPMQGGKGVRNLPGQGVIERRRAFVKLFNRRMPAAIDAILNLAYLADRKNYKSTEEDWDKALNALRKAVEVLEAKVRSPDEMPVLFEPLDENGE